ncbi:hypothetical protein B0H10DRAFT_2230302 [Mycena sp. CBHHK59/15]|nr:hypothetical protein B0H10DRAFT_2230302 [Mycena sp. CBHHK59/15]
MSGVDSLLLLPNGQELLVRMAYTSREVQGVTVLVVISCISLIAVVGLLATISLSAFNTRSSLDQHLFVRTHVAAYFISLLLCDLVQAIGSILNAKWVGEMAVGVGNICVLQGGFLDPYTFAWINSHTGVLKQIADVGTAFWTFVIALHTFCLLFLELKSRRFVLYTTLIAGWSGIATIVIAGPAALDTTRRGPFFGISGYWCWITPEYSTERVTLDYMFLDLPPHAGNIVLTGKRIQFRRRGTNEWRGKQFEDQALAIARQMLLYPVAYTILILPIAASRFSSWSGDDVPFPVTIFSAAVFLLSGIVNVTLFTTTRRLLPADSLRMPTIRKAAISRPQPIPEYTIESGPDSYYQSSGTYAESYAEKDPVDSMPPSPAPLQIRTEVSQTLSPPPMAHAHGRESGESVYNFYESNIPLTPPDARPNPEFSNFSYRG